MEDGSRKDAKAQRKYVDGFLFSYLNPKNGLCGSCGSARAK